jgi:hypothetical protein
MPEARLQGVDKAPPSATSMMTFKMAVSIVDPIESAAFMRYLPDRIRVDQDLDARDFSPDHSRAISIFTDEAIPLHPKIARALGMTEEPNAHNHYIWLANEVDRHLNELGAVSVSPVLIFRTSGGMGHRPLLGALFKLRYEIPDGQTRYDIGSNLGLLTDKRTPELHVDEA